MFSIKSNASGKIMAEVLDNCGDIKSTHTFQNIITSRGLENWAKSPLPLYLAIGAGIREESENITGLDQYKKSVYGTYSVRDVNYHDTLNNVIRSTHVITATMPLETSSQNYSEMGLHSNNVNQLHTYAPFLDANNLPTSVSVLEGEQLRITYEIQFSIPEQYSFNAEIGGVPTTVTFVGNTSGERNVAKIIRSGLTTTGFWGAGEEIPLPQQSVRGHSIVSRYSTVVENQWSLQVFKNELNFPGGISLIQVGREDTEIGFYLHFDPPINKTSDNILNLKISTQIQNGGFHA